MLCCVEYCPDVYEHIMERIPEPCALETRRNGAKNIPPGGGCIMRKVLPPAYLFIAVVVMGVLYFIIPGENIIAFPWNLFGFVPLAVGVVINLLADRAFKGRATTVKPFESSTALITTGVFRLSRHPMCISVWCLFCAVSRYSPVL